MARKLELHKETLRALNDADLTEVAGGGAESHAGPGCGPFTIITLTCTYTHSSPGTCVTCATPG